MNDALTTSEAAELLDVSTATLKRWADAGLVAYERTAGGHRRFRRAALEVFAGARGTVDDGAAPWADALLHAASDIEVQALLVRERARHGCWWKVAEVLEPVVIELHRRRDRGLVTAVQWLGAFAALERALAHFGAQAPAGPRAPAVLLAAVPGDRLLQPLALAQLGAAHAGWRTRWGGHARPTELEEELRRERPDALLLSASDAADPAEVDRSARALDGLAATGVAVGVIGLGAWPDPLEGGVRLRSSGELRAWLGRASGGRVAA